MIGKTISHYNATAKANAAGVAWREGNLLEANTNGQAALATWQQLPTGHASSAFRWTMQQSFSGLMLSYAQGDAIDMKETLKTFPLKLTSVRNYAESALAAS